MANCANIRKMTKQIMVLNHKINKLVNAKNSAESQKSIAMNDLLLKEKEANRLKNQLEELG